MAEEDVKGVTVHMENLDKHPQCAHGDYFLLTNLILKLACLIMK